MSPDTFLSGFKAPIFSLHGMIFFALLGHPALGEDTLFSGPRKGETATPFQAFGVREPLQGKVVEVLGNGDSAKVSGVDFCSWIGAIDGSLNAGCRCQLAIDTKGGHADRLGLSFG